MARGMSFSAVESIGCTLPNVEVGTAWGKPALRVRGKMFACMAANKAAEPNTLVVITDFANRDALIDEDPQTYYLKPHYVDYPCVLVRLSRIDRDALHDLLTGAHHWVSSKTKRMRRRTREGPT